MIGLSSVDLIFGCHSLTDASLLNSEDLRSVLMNRLVKVEPANDILAGPLRDSNAIIYVLGGGQQSLESRFKKAAVLYRNGAAGRVLIMSRPGITEYSSQLGRNLTNDEWAIGKLKDLGIHRDDIEFVSIPEDFWGTYNEAKAISGLTIKRGYRYLLLVSSPYHTRRVWESFSKMLQGSNVSILVFASDDTVNLNGLIIEYFKLLTYNYLLLPLHHSPNSVN